jgi:hypothetical protein
MIATNEHLISDRRYALILTSTVNTPLAFCEVCSRALDVTGRMLIAMAGRL